jgi:CRISPR-associated protein Csx17
MNNMAGQEFHEIELRGCTEEPLINYLKALGIFRIVHKQKDKSVKGYWKNGYFCLKTVLSPEELEKFFLEEFEPSPFFGPWGSRSGFWMKVVKKDRENLLNEL